MLKLKGRWLGKSAQGPDKPHYKTIELKDIGVGG